MHGIHTHTHAHTTEHIRLCVTVHSHTHPTQHKQKKKLESVISLLFSPLQHCYFSKSAHIVWWCSQLCSVVNTWPIQTSSTYCEDQNQRGDPGPKRATTIRDTVLSSIETSLKSMTWAERLVNLSIFVTPEILISIAPENLLRIFFFCKNWSEIHITILIISLSLCYISW